MPVLNGIDVVRPLLASGSKAKFIVLPLPGRRATCASMLCRRRMAYVVKSRIDMDLTTAIRKVLSGRQFILPSIKG
jgi:DNA-binding NarL/FixJ family response regulator